MNADKSSQGKLGLCLSGGGFRAALFHIGTLAALAERELLHEVEVLSTVSGGSIIGAYYYLKVKQLLEGKRPGCPIPEPGHYLDVVHEIERDFLSAVQKNMRMQLFLNPYKTARMLLEEKYSRSDRLSELLNTFFYNHVALVDGIRLKEIHITPHNANQYPFGNDGKFSVRQYNAAEKCKIPVLTINASCLNTGHPWHFTGAWMGEPDRKIESGAKKSLYDLEENSNYILPQLRFDGHYQHDRSRRVEGRQLEIMDSILLSDAVAASAAVPGIFPPLPIHGLYHSSKGEEIVVELADGGVFDNQGLDALFAAKCTRIVVSDASGQLEDERLLSTNFAQVIQRANNVMMERIRGYGYFGLCLRQLGCRKIAATDTLHTGICFIESDAFTHLRETAPNTPDMPALPGPANQPNGVVYRLSGMRTDLDSFSDLEAYSLMYQGYSLAQDRLAKAGMGISTNTIPSHPWHFLTIREVIRKDLCLVNDHLKVGKKKFFKSFYLAPFQSFAWLFFLLSPPLLYVIFWLIAYWETPITLPHLEITGEELLGCAIALILTLAPISSKVREGFKTLPWLRVFKQNPVAGGATVIFSYVITILAVVASLAMFAYLEIFNNIFLRNGKLEGKKSRS